MVYLKSVENVITLGKLIGLLLLFCLPLFSILFLKTKSNDLAHPVMGTIFLVIHRCIKLFCHIVSQVRCYCNLYLLSFIVTMYLTKFLYEQY